MTRESRDPLSVLREAARRLDDAIPVGVEYTRQQIQDDDELKEAIAQVEAWKIKAERWDDLQHARETTKAEPDDCEWKQLARSGQVIPAIKLCRAKHGFSLRESKDCVEGYIRTFTPTDSEGGGHG